MKDINDELIAILRDIRDNGPVVDDKDICANAILKTKEESNIAVALMRVYENLGLNVIYPLGEAELYDKGNRWDGERKERRVELINKCIAFLEKESARHSDNK